MRGSLDAGLVTLAAVLCRVQKLAPNGGQIFGAQERT